MERRTILKGIAASWSATLPLAARSQTAKVRVGYLHTLAVDGQMWLAESMGLWKKEGLDMDFVAFQTGLELFQAMTGGSIDVLSTGAVLSNFPARGQGRVFLANDIEFATAQLWVHPDMGIASIADLKGKKVSTTTGTTAHVFLDTALRANHIDPKDVDIVNQRMQDAVSAFISKAVPAVALWVPFNIPLRQKVPTAKKLVDASAFYPQAAIVDGWAARNDYFDTRKDVLAKIVRVWAQANDAMIADPTKALETLQRERYPNVTLPDLTEMYGDQKMFTSAQWRKYYEDGTVTKWLQQTTDFFTAFSKIDNAVPASRYFDPSIFLAQVKG